MVLLILLLARVIVPLAILLWLGESVRRREINYWLPLGTR